MRFFTYVYVRVLNTRQWTTLRVLSTPYVYVRKGKAGKQPLSYTGSKKTCNFYKEFKRQHEHFLLRLPGSWPKTRMGVLGTSQTKTCVVRAHPLRRSSVYWKEHFHTHKDIFLRLVNLVPRRYPRETQFFEMLSPCLSEWQLLCGVWQQVEVFGRSLPTSMSESQHTCTLQ